MLATNQLLMLLAVILIIAAATIWLAPKAAPLRGWSLGRPLIT